MAINSRQKGNRFEREIAKVLSNWAGETFQRRSMGYVGSDLITPNDFPFAVEVKNNKADILDIFRYKSELNGWWAQALAQSVSEGKEPLLAFKHGQKGRYFMITQPMFGAIKEMTGEDASDCIRYGGIVVMPIEKFLKFDYSAIIAVKTLK